MEQTLNTEQKALKFADFKELNEQELRETEGGLTILGAACIALAVCYLANELHGLSKGKRFEGMP